ncbi:hypothetical protein HPB49_014133 [Dermacentor silvarum]|uniref:Uncharacterized protein n=1 Tax=Dermacentor silvarum TaxID=543639 RepID=A0ACB8CRQ4_DERSI|nr:hypothetical protein HPB49_014133 [Dermacentor silvarum]
MRASTSSLDGESRWPQGLVAVPERMGTIKDLSRFDAQFFGVPPRQANVMDPQLRLLLETSYEAIVDAGYDPSTMRGHRVGVFAGCILSETRVALNVDVDEVDGHTLVDNLSAMLANRVSYAFDFNGPSITVDTASSSTMTALNQAVLALRSGQCTAAIVGGANLILDPVTTLNEVRLGILSRDGKCKSFDSRGECYRIILQDNDFQRPSPALVVRSP